MASVRESDVVARLGGDEFVVVLTGADAVAAERVAAKMLKALSQPYQIDGQGCTRRRASALPSSPAMAKPSKS
jgi:diguanylate cyclase (GGDEF)-like protein